MRQTWFSRLFSASRPEQGFDLLAHPDLAGLSARALADLPLWPAPDEQVQSPSRPIPVAELPRREAGRLERPT
jgi:hypothetical protein